MQISTSELKTRAKSKLKNNYGQAIVVVLIEMSITALITAGTTGISTFKTIMDSMETGYDIRVTYSPLASIGTLAAFLLGGPILVGTMRYFLNLCDGRGAQITDIFSQFNNFLNTFVMQLLINLFTFLWTLLLFIPGLIASFSYAMTPFILAEHPEIGASDAIKMSKKMMQGHKGEYFLLQLSFIGWYFLCALTLGIGVFFLMPYIHAASTEFFNEVSGKNYERQMNAASPYGQPGGNFTNVQTNGYQQTNDPNAYGQTNTQSPAGQTGGNFTNVQYSGYRQTNEPDVYGQTGSYTQTNAPGTYEQTGSHTQTNEPDGFTGSTDGQNNDQ